MRATGRDGEGEAERRGFGEMERSRVNEAEKTGAQESNHPGSGDPEGAGNREIGRGRMEKLSRRRALAALAAAVAGVAALGARVLSAPRGEEPASNLAQRPGERLLDRKVLPELGPSPGTVKRRG
jgi:ferric-dicitrate binding protein FerR (iron transport regulator)